MSWYLFLYVVVVPGALLTMMLLSGVRLCGRFASLVLETPVRIGSSQVSIAMFMMGLSVILSTVGYSGLKRCEERYATTDFGMQIGSSDRYMKDIFHQGRNLYLSLLGFTLWSISWRMKALHASGGLGQEHSNSQEASGSTATKGRALPTSARVKYLVVALLALIVADIPVCRINYSIQLATFVTPKKHQLLKDFGSRCEGAMLASASGECSNFCSEARQLSNERDSAIQWTRSWHMTGKFAAQLFDGARGVKQGTQRIDKLYHDRSCLDVLGSVDKSNKFVNFICWVIALVAVLAFFVALGNLLGGQPADAAEPQRLVVEPIRPHAD